MVREVETEEHSPRASAFAVTERIPELACRSVSAAIMHFDKSSAELQRGEYWGWL